MTRRLVADECPLELGELPEVDLFTSDERILDFLSRYNRRFAQFDLTPLIEPLLI
jgi:hypothetical protein